MPWTKRNRYEKSDSGDRNDRRGSRRSSSTDSSSRSSSSESRSSSRSRGWTPRRGSNRLMQTARKYAPGLHAALAEYNEDRKETIKSCLQESRETSARSPGSKNPLDTDYLASIYEWLLDQCEKGDMKGSMNGAKELLNKLRVKQTSKSLKLFRGLADVSRVAECGKLGKALADFFSEYASKIIKEHRHDPNRLAEWCFAIHNADMSDTDKNECLALVLDQRNNFVQEVHRLSGQKFEKLEGVLKKVERSM